MKLSLIIRFLLSTLILLFVSVRAYAQASLAAENIIDQVPVKIEDPNGVSISKFTVIRDALTLTSGTTFQMNLASPYWGLTLEPRRNSRSYAMPLAILKTTLSSTEEGL